MPTDAFDPVSQIDTDEYWTWKGGGGPFTYRAPWNPGPVAGSPGGGQYGQGAGFAPWQQQNSFGWQPQQFSPLRRRQGYGWSGSPRGQMSGGAMQMPPQQAYAGMGGMSMQVPDYLQAGGGSYQLPGTPQSGGALKSGRFSLPWDRGRGGRGGIQAPAPGLPPVPIGEPPAGDPNAYWSDMWNRMQGGMWGQGGPQRSESDAVQWLMGLASGQRPTTGPFARGGDPETRAMILNEGARRGLALQGQAATAANMANVDPSMRNWMQLQSLMGSQQAAARSANDYAMQNEQAIQNMARNNWMNFMENWANIGPDWRRGEQNTGNLRQGSNTNWAGMLGSGLGTALPYILPMLLQQAQSGGGSSYVRGGMR